MAEFATFLRFSFVACSTIFLPTAELITFLAKAEFATLENTSKIPAPCAFGLMTNMILSHIHHYTPLDLGSCA